MLASSGLDVDIVSPEKRNGTEGTLGGKAFTWHFVPESASRFGLPTVVRMLLMCIFLHLKRTRCMFVGGDMLGGIVAAVMCVVFRKPYICYGLELPNRKHSGSSLAVWLEHWALRRATLVVTMDSHHSVFISKEVGVKPAKFGFLPVARSGMVRVKKSNLLREKFGLTQADIVILHAGGVGAAQESLQLAQSASSWPSNWHLVFHLHCRLEHESYFQEFARIVEELPNVHISSEPLDPAALDELVASADITVAWYDRELLGYRADLLGLAPGKVGRSLRNGIPIVVRDLFSIREYVDKYQCGICVSRLGDIPQAISRILKNHGQYRRNAGRCYDELWRPEHYLPELGRRVKELAGI